MSIESKFAKFCVSVSSLPTNEEEMADICEQLPGADVSKIAGIFSDRVTKPLSSWEDMRLLTEVHSRSKAIPKLGADPIEGFSKLNPRERMVLENFVLLARAGISKDLNQTLASIMGISRRGIYNSWNNIYNKIGIRSRKKILSKYLEEP